jgi:hypothetical protein
MTEIHMTARQRETVAALLADDSDFTRLGACSISADDEYVVVKFERESIYVNENGAVS